MLLVFLKYFLKIPLIIYAVASGNKYSHKLKKKNPKYKKNPVTAAAPALPWSSASAN